jgi:hypothetical protein
MRHFFAVLIAALLMTAAAMAQTQTRTNTTEVQAPTVLMAGTINSQASDTLVHRYASSVGAQGEVAVAKFPSFYTALDTVRNAATANDSAWCSLYGYYHSVSFQVQASIDSGTNCDSVAVQFWSSTNPIRQAPHKLRQTTNMASTVGTAQVFTWEPASGIGNPFTNYKLVVDVQDAVNQCRVSWQAWMIVR